LLGPSRLVRAFPSWFVPSSFAADLKQSARNRDNVVQLSAS
jgi:hypothetical protein